MSESCCSSSSHICWGSGEEHPGEHSLRAENISYSYGRTQALSRVNFETTCGKSLALIGPNGAGKSTLLKLMAGIMRPTEGTLSWRGVILRGTSREIAYLPQRSQVNWSFPITVRGVVEMGRYPTVGILGRFCSHDREIVERALETLGLMDLADRQVGALSGGQQQKAFLARAIAQEAHVLLLDEPFTGLDQPTSDSLVEILRSFTREGRLLVASHHDLESVERLFDEVILLNKSLIAKGPSAFVLTQENLKKAYSYE